MIGNGRSWVASPRRIRRAVLLVAVALFGATMLGMAPRPQVLLSSASHDEPTLLAAVPQEASASAAVEEEAQTVAQAVCRPSAPAVEPTPGRSFVVDRGPAECSTVALTFDAGADRGYAELILDILRENGIPATFGMTGRWAEENPELVQRMADEGHQIMNHTWSHRSFTGYSPQTRALGPGERRVELDRTEELIQGLTGRATRPYWRPPYGDLNGGVLADAADAGFDYTIMWTVDSLGWNRLSAREVAARCLRNAEAGTIYLFHVGADSSDAQALGTIIEGVRARGLGFVTIADMLRL